MGAKRSRTGAWELVLGLDAVYSTNAKVARCRRLYQRRWLKAVYSTNAKVARCRLLYQRQGGSMRAIYSTNAKVAQCRLHHQRQGGSMPSTPPTPRWLNAVYSTNAKVAQNLMMIAVLLCLSVFVCGFSWIVISLQFSAFYFDFARFPPLREMPLISHASKTVHVIAKGHLTLRRKLVYVCVLPPAVLAPHLCQRAPCA